MSESAYRQTLVISPGELSGRLKDFPLLLNIKERFLRSVENDGNVAGNDGGDIHFLSQSGNLLPHTIERYCPESGALRARVCIPTLNSNSKIQICVGEQSEKKDLGSPWKSGFRMIQVEGGSVRSEDLELEDALTVEAWVHTDLERTDTFQTLVSKWSSRPVMDAFESYDAGNTDGLDTKGFFGSVSDGRYVYFVPQLNDSQSRHGQALRYDSHGPFDDPKSWSGYDAGHTAGLNTRGYYGAVHAGEYIYFIPRTDGESHHSRLLRYDRRGDFTDYSSWDAHDIGNPVSSQSAAFDGRYIYITPGYEMDGSETGKAVKFDTYGDFKDAGSYVIYDAGNTDGLESKNYDGATFDGRYVYYSPLNNRGIVLRHDTLGDFDDPKSWASNDISSLGMEMCVGAIFDGRYIYYVQYAHTKAVRYDTLGDFRNLSSWEVYDAGRTSGLNTCGYDGAVFDGQYIYYVPFVEDDASRASDKHGFHCRVLRYNASLNFTDAAAWEAVDGGVFTYPPNPGGFNGGAFDGRYAYFAPWREDPEETDKRGFTPHGKVLRYDTTEDAAFTLKYVECGHNGGLCASMPGPTLTLITSEGTRSVRANRNLSAGWHHIAGTYDGQAITLYIDGEAVNSIQASGTVNPSNSPLTIGSLIGGGARFLGTIAEVRISNTSLSPDWIRTTMQNLSAPDSFVTLAP
ncbi:MAG TPA: hypothetical protein DIU35_16660 [Candidatus Latescibacteria bacterium]|nr:hypothetical protein [Gemmatimonadota bacterium]HCR19111.1 hypothetical protein [Candidatus Latescibacterota bacterium]